MYDKQDVTARVKDIITLLFELLPRPKLFEKETQVSVLQHRSGTVHNAVERIPRAPSAELLPAFALRLP